MTKRIRAVVVVAYGNASLLAGTLRALAGKEHVLVVDNSSDPDVRAASEAAGAHYLDAEANNGFAAGVNLALRTLARRGFEGDVLLLNPDARVNSADIDRLQAAFEAPDAADLAAVSPSLTSPPGLPERVSWPFPSPSGMWLEALGSGRRPRRAAGFVVGAVLLLRREALADVGEFDERYFLYAEETDWQRRAVERGWRCIEFGDVRAMHVGAGTSADSERREVLFHAGQETYIRRWFGPLGWTSYRAAAIAGALLRAALTRGARRRRAKARAALYLRGPRKVAQLPARQTALRITHLVVTGNAAGTERYVAEVASRQAAAGHSVTVVGGDRDYMASALTPSVIWRRGESTYRAAASLLAAGGCDIVHSHLTAADLLAVATIPRHGGTVVSTRHIAKERGASVAARLASWLLQRGITQEISISAYVQRSVGVESVVVHNGVAPDDRRPRPDSHTVLVAQRLESEKATDVALAAWAASDLGRHGWTLLVCGEGSERDSLHAMQHEHDIVGVDWFGWARDVREVMLDCAVLLAPATAEPFGLTVAEAMSVGLPVIASAAAGHLETVGQSGHAMLFAPGDVDSCAAALRDFARLTDDERTAYGEDLRAIQRSRFDLDRCVERVNALYRAALGSNVPPNPRIG